MKTLRQRFRKRIKGENLQNIVTVMVSRLHLQVKSHFFLFRDLKENL